MTKVETHNGTSYQTNAEMVYNGLGQRLAMTASQAGLFLTSQYVLDGNALLAATANGQSTYYLTGLAEFQAAWAYYLPDGQQSVRQVTNASGLVILNRRFTPWGEVYSQDGSTHQTFGYLGGVLDAANGLIYVGNGQYYDPATGRFLSRGVNPVSTNPYVP